MELARLVSVHELLMANLSELSRQDGEWQGKFIVFFRNNSGHSSLVSQSSLTLALLRCILTEGTVYYDGIPTSQINLDALRSNITIIPQTVSATNDVLITDVTALLYKPELLSGAYPRTILHSSGLHQVE